MNMTPSTLRRRAALRILVVEDAVVHQKLAMKLLASLGHSVTVTENGQQALDALESQPFDLVLMDVEMPVMDGLTATGAIRRRESECGGHLAIVAVTSSSGPEECLAAGMDAFISKPLRNDALNLTMQQIWGD